MDIQQLKQIMAQAGDVGAGGAGFPSSVKLAEGADTLIINAAECEPLLYTDYYIMKTHLERILAGAEVLMEAAGIRSGFLGLKKHTAARLSIAHGQLLSEHVKAYALPDVYPMGDEIILIYEVLRRVVPPGELPLSAGVLVFNAETLYNVNRAVAHGEPVTEKWITVGGKISRPTVLRVPVGTAVSDLFTHLGIRLPEDCVVVNGGPAMGQIVDFDTAVVTKTTKGLLVLPANLPAILGKTQRPEGVRGRASSACCQCTFCTEMCPRALIGYPLEPHKAVRSTPAQVEADPQSYAAAALCCGCGVCELTACCQGLSPRKIFQEPRDVLARNGVRFHGAAREVNPDRDFRLLPTERFKERIGVAAYDGLPDFDETRWIPDRVTLLMRQHVGVPAVPVVQAGDEVEKGTVAGEPGKGLSAPIHSSIAGRVLSVSESAVTIGR